MLYVGVYEYELHMQFENFSLEQLGFFDNEQSKQKINYSKYENSLKGDK